MKLWPRSLAGQLIAGLLIALVTAQVVTFVFFASERREAIINARHELVVQRTVSLVETLESLPAGTNPKVEPSVLGAATSSRLRFWVAGSPTVNPTDAAADNFMARVLAERFSLWSGRDRAVLVEMIDADGGRLSRAPEAVRRWHEDWHGKNRLRRDDDDGGHHKDHGDDRRDELDAARPVGLALAVELSDGRWLNGEMTAFRPRAFGARTMTLLLVMALCVSVVVVLVVRRLTRPLGALAHAADALGRGEVPPPLVPMGPSELRRTIVAFNTMQERLHRFVADRTRMLAAISHDLRTPLTSLRLRAEFITDDAENKQKILNILDEMERITEATLAFARDEQAGGQTASTDVAALCGDVAQELGDMGLDVTFTPTGPAVMTCQPTAIKRAIRNLAQNAVHYGGRARLAARLGNGEILVTVEDDGPGIPEADQDSVFEPFTRLETSRSHETGGVGLGLAITRNIVRAHGGDIRLENLTPRGLRVTVSLPLPSDGD
ncbi:ATP-binding protein [Thalassospiraceae bacterium LMO-SO8]|nr:ATP-binding protein [Alphaproteobacteria bacterium LMO-S08]WND76849.1 ATP-binding protein [Thalassospiraceae bacterium LMO-SO8]